jgi:hypothetical protein
VSQVGAESANVHGLIRGRFRKMGRVFLPEHKSGHIQCRSGGFLTTGQEILGGCPGFLGLAQDKGRRDQIRSMGEGLVRRPSGFQLI